MRLRVLMSLLELLGLAAIWELLGRKAAAAAFFYAWFVAYNRYKLNYA